MKTLTCKCGQAVILNYKEGGFCFKYDVVKTGQEYYKWVCSWCGREYIQKKPEPVEISPEPYEKGTTEKSIVYSDLSEAYQAKFDKKDA